jgi:nucleoside-diphosphate-sugar epimerase
MMIQERIDGIDEARSKEKTEMEKGRLGKLIMEAVDNVFSSLGNSCKLFLYFRLKNSYNISAQEIPNRIEDFADALEAIFGPGAKLIEIEIMKVLFSRTKILTYSLKQEDLSFTDYVKKLCNF